MNIKIDEGSRRILGNISIETIVRLPKMTDTQYDKIKYIMEYAGGHWREKYGGFQFDEDTSIISSRIHSIMSAGQIIIPDDIRFQIKNQFYPTPSALAEYMVNLADIKPTDLVLEPSAGRGSILSNIVKKTNRYKAIELNKDNAAYLRQLGYDVTATSFEQFYSITKMMFDKVVMNPPFSNKRDIIHTVLAYNLLKPGGTLVSLLAENSIYYNRPITRLFNNFLSSRKCSLTSIPHGTFKESGTNVDVVMLVINKHTQERIDISKWK